VKRQGNPDGLRDGADKRKIAVHNALVEAYKRLERGEPTVVKKTAPITASNVAKEAGVNRTVLYINHRDILEKIQRTKIERKAGFKGRSRTLVKEAEVRIDELRDVITVLQKEKNDLATVTANLHHQKVQLQEDLDRVTKERDELRRQVAKVTPLRGV